MPRNFYMKLKLSGKQFERQINQEITVVKNIKENFKKEKEVKSHTLPVSKLLTKTFPTVDNTYSPDVEVHQIKAQQYYVKFQSFKIEEFFGYLSKGPGLKLVETHRTSFDGFTKILPLDYDQAVIYRRIVESYRKSILINTI